MRENREIEFGELKSRLSQIECKQSRRPFCGRLAEPQIHICSLFVLDGIPILAYNKLRPGSPEGVFRRLPAGGAGGGSLRAGLVIPHSGRPGLASAGITTRKSGLGFRKMPRWSADRRAPRVMGRGTPRHGVFGVPRHGTFMVRRSAPAPLGALPPRVHAEGFF